MKVWDASTLQEVHEMQDLHHWVRALALDTKRVGVRFLAQVSHCTIIMKNLQEKETWLMSYVMNSRQRHPASRTSFYFPFKKRSFKRKAVLAKRDKGS